jgi:hypothetical protein
MSQTQDRQFASMHEVVMKKDELLKSLVENKARHDALFDAAVLGYWGAAKQQLDDKRTQLSIALKEFDEDAQIKFGRFEKKIEAKETLPSYIDVKGFNWSATLSLTYPENHTKDYERAIRKMEASVYDEVKLTDAEFNQYVLNDWSWRNQFIASNSLFIMSGATFYPRNANPSGYVHNSTTGVFYANARNDTLNYITASGCNGLRF